MAEGIARDMCSKSQNAVFSSMGTQALVNSEADPKAVAVCAEIGVDISSHRGKQLDIKALMESEKIFCMDRGHLQYVSSLSPVIAEKTVLLTDFPKKRIFSKDIWDPYKTSIRKFRKSRDMIKKELERITPLL